MTRFTRGFLMASALSAAAMMQVPGALAQDSTTTTPKASGTVNVDASTNIGVNAVDAGKLIDQDVYDAKGDKIGDIESVIVDPSGKVTSVVINVGGWLSSDKRISVPWTDLKSGADGKIVSSMTKEQAQAAAGYSYKDDSLRGKIQTAAGKLFNPSGQTASTTANGTTSANTSTSTSTASTSSMLGTPVRNADGTLNASQVIGMDVVNKNDDSIGKISELVLGKSGQVSGVVVDVGGFLGIGAHPVLLDWKQVSLVNKDGSTVATVNKTKENLKQMPAYTASK